MAVQATLQSLRDTKTMVLMFELKGAPQQDLNRPPRVPVTLTDLHVWFLGILDVQVTSHVPHETTALIPVRRKAHLRFVLSAQVNHRPWSSTNLPLQTQRQAWRPLRHWGRQSRLKTSAESPCPWLSSTTNCLQTRQCFYSAVYYDPCPTLPPLTCPFQQKPTNSTCWRWSSTALYGLFTALSWSSY